MAHLRPSTSQITHPERRLHADALVSGVENLASPLYAEAVEFIDDAVAGVAPVADLPVTADSQADTASGAAALLPSG